MEPFLAFLVLYAIGCTAVLPIYFYFTYLRRKKKANSKDNQERILFGYSFWPSTMNDDVEAYHIQRGEAVALATNNADEFLNAIKKDYWVQLGEYSKDDLQRCEEFTAYNAGFLKLSLILEHEAKRYTAAMKHRHDDGVTLKESAINEAVDVVLFKACCRTFEVQLNLIDKHKAMEIYDFCKTNLSFLDHKYQGILEMDPAVSGLRRKDK